jgi:SAM-dependent methyltransferase
VAGRNGLEIGGPSRVFSAEGILPLYQVVESMDNVTFASRTIWEGELSRNREYHFDADKLPGKQFILDATELSGIATGSYDFLLSSHVLEHLANPLRGLREWLRVVKEGGVLVLVLPHRDGTFDHLRPVTTIEHMLEDYAQERDEHDVSHVEETRELHDLKYDEGVSGRAEFEQRLRNNATERSLHHHVFSTLTVAQLLDRGGLQILSLETVRPCHIVAVALKVSHTDCAVNRPYLDPTLPLYSRSPFRTDRTERS